jgi:hypothetical protein
MDGHSCHREAVPTLPATRHPPPHSARASRLSIPPPKGPAGAPHDTSTDHAHLTAPPHHARSLVSARSSSTHELGPHRSLPTSLVPRVGSASHMHHHRCMYVGCRASCTLQQLRRRSERGAWRATHSSTAACWCVWPLCVYGGPRCTGESSRVVVGRVHTSEAAQQL